MISVGGHLETESDYEYYRNKRVCDLHFKNEHRNRFNRLNILAVPFPIGKFHVYIVLFLMLMFLLYTG